jgi:hypothetical protein
MQSLITKLIKQTIFTTIVKGDSKSGHSCMLDENIRCCFQRSTCLTANTLCPSSLFCNTSHKQIQWVALNITCITEFSFFLTKRWETKDGLYSSKNASFYLPISEAKCSICPKFETHQIWPVNELVILPGTALKCINQYTKEQSSIVNSL